MNIISGIGTISSILGLALVENLPFIIRIIIAFVGCFAFLYLVHYYVKNSKVEKKMCYSNDEIKDVMKKIIKNNGKICIMSRDLSWVDSEIEFSIVQKAKDILIFAEKESELTIRLIKNGVTIKYYSHLNFKPKTRFTVIRYNQREPQVAIANTQNTILNKNEIQHLIYQTSKNVEQDEWINSLALDLINLCDLTFESRDKNEKIKD